MKLKVQRVTRKAISDAINAATGYDVGVHGSQQEGCYSFYSDDPKTGLLLAAFYTTTIYVNNLSDLTVDRWVEEFEEMLDKHKKGIRWG